MAIKGLSKLVLAKYTAAGNTVTYTDAALSEKMVSYTLDITQSENNPLYLDNEIAEMDIGRFQSGLLTVNTGDLSYENTVLILNVKEKTITTPNNETVKELIYDDEMKPQTLGGGLIELHQIENVDKYRAIFFNKLTFAIPKDAADTRAESIKWQTREITASIMRSDELSEDYKRPWKSEAWFDDEISALNYLMFKGGKKQEMKGG